MACVWESTSPGASSRPAQSMRVAPPYDRSSSACGPIAAICSPTTATATPVTIAASFISRPRRARAGPLQVTTCDALMNNNDWGVGTTDKGLGAPRGWFVTGAGGWLTICGHTSLHRGLGVDDDDAVRSETAGPLR